MHSLWIRGKDMKWQRIGDFHTREGAELREDQYTQKYETLILPRGILPQPGRCKR